METLPGRWKSAMAHRGTRRLFLLTLLGPAAVVFLLAVMLPAVRTLSETAREPAEPHGEPAAVAAEDRAAQQRLLTRVDSLRVAEAFLTTRLELAERDEISLAVDLVEGALYLDIQGVPVRRMPIRRFHVSAPLKQMKRQGRLGAWIGEPFTLESDDATIPRAPVRFVNAPRDTVEAQALPPKEIPVETDPTHFALRFNKGLTLRVDQQTSFSGLLSKALFDVRERIRTAGRTVHRLAGGQAPPHESWISLELSPEDAKAVYRALPEDARIALRF